MNRKLRAQSLRKTSTDAENRLWGLLRNRQLDGWKFRRQAPIGNYIVDFVCLDAKVVVEVDGGHHQEQAGYDEGRSKWLRYEGYRVLRFWNNQVLKEIESVQESILRTRAWGRSGPLSLRPLRNGGC